MVATRTISRISIVLVVIISIGVLLYLANYGIVSQAVPPFDHFIASTTMRDTITTTQPETLLATTSLLRFHAPGGIIYSHVARTPSSRESGLSGHAPLSVDEGMLFIFPDPGNYPFWMKGMNFSIDIVWMSADKRVVGITKNISPETYPKTFSPSTTVQFVLEVLAGSAEKFGIKEGSIVSF